MYDTLKEEQVKMLNYFCVTPFVFQFSRGPNTI